MRTPNIGKQHRRAVLTCRAQPKSERSSADRAVPMGMAATDVEGRVAASIRSTLVT